MSTIFRSFIFATMLLFLVPTFTQARIWTSSNGRTLEAELVEYKDGVAQLKRADGTIVSVRKNQLSQADQNFLEAGVTTNVEPVSLTPVAKLETHAISVTKKTPPFEMREGRFIPTQHEGTVVSLIVQMPDYSIITLNEEASKITKFVDDKNNDLLKVVPRAGGVMGMMGMDMMNVTTPPLRAYPAGQMMLINCSSPNCPAPGTQAITLEGQLVLQCGQGTKTTEQKNIPLDGKGKFEAGGITVTIKKEEQDQQVGLFGGMSGMSVWGGSGMEMKTRISMTSTKSLDSVISYTFLDADGDEIEWQDAGSFWTDQLHTEYFQLAEEVDVLTIQLEEYEKIETITLPVSIKVGLGL